MSRSRPLRTALATAALALAGLVATAVPATAAPPAATIGSTAAPHALSSAVRFCNAGSWTQVNWYVNPFWPLSYRYTVEPGVSVQWRWFSAGVPYWQGSFAGTGDIWTPPSVYTSVEFLCSRSSTVVITPL